MFGASGAIDGLAAFYPKAVVRLWDLLQKLPIDAKALNELRDLQYRICRAEEFIGKWGIGGIKLGVKRVLGMGRIDAQRLPLRIAVPDAEWEKWGPVMQEMEKVESSL
jgi:2-keto-3-deoxy-L-rhamnonate aldolase